ncbi:MAG: V-type ATP synthase subunit E family protein [Firmicutes bacterium]|nr:V-type ATP synthase subunit E family protein [[Eubacterium] siraeum]MCM1487599.1 V-type ATP synthase subunit E family protein [Bacillota bacterium]
MEIIEKIARFEEAIKAESEAEANAVLSAAQTRAGEAVSCADEEYLERVYSVVSVETKNIKRKYARLVSQKEFEASKAVFSHRNRAVEEFFRDMAKEISDFTATEEYRQELKRLLSETEKESGFDPDTVAYVKAEDAELVKKLYPNLDVKTDKGIKLGGVNIFYPQRSLYVDKTLDNAFEQQKEEFVGNGFMQL